MNLGSLFRFLDVHHAIYMVDDNHFPEFVTSEIQFPPGPYITFLRVKGITIGWHLLPTVYAFHKPQPCQPYSLVEQVFIVHFR
jgi:hypothetical protein